MLWLLLYVVTTSRLMGISRFSMSCYFMFTLKLKIGNLPQKRGIAQMSGHICLTCRGFGNTRFVVSFNRKGTNSPVLKTMDCLLWVNVLINK